MHKKHSVIQEFARDYSRYIDSENPENYNIPANQVVTSESHLLNRRLGIHSVNKYSKDYKGDLYKDEIIDYFILNEVVEEPIDIRLEVNQRYGDIDTSGYSTSNTFVLQDKELVKGLNLTEFLNMSREAFLKHDKNKKNLKKKREKRERQEKIEKELKGRNRRKSDARKRASVIKRYKRVADFSIQEKPDQIISLSNTFEYRCSCGCEYSLEPVSKHIEKHEMIIHGCSECGSDNLIYEGFKNDFTISLDKIIRERKKELGIK